MPSSPPTKRATSSGRGKLVKVRGVENLYRYTTTGTYYVIYYRNGRTTKLSLKTTDRLTAKQTMAEVLRDASRVGHQNGGATTVRELLDLHMKTRVSQRAPQSQYKAGWISKMLADTWPCPLTQKVRDVKRSHIDGWIGHHRNRPGASGEQLSKSTLNEYIQFVRALFATAVDEGYITDSPVDGVKDFKRDRPIRRTPTMEEFRRIVTDLRSQFFNARYNETADFVEFLGLSGLGNGEAANLNWEHFRFAYNEDGSVDWGRTKIHILRQKTNRGFVISVFRRFWEPTTNQA